MIQLRWYQDEAVASVHPLEGRKLIVIPTGGGKSLVAAKLAQDAAMLDRVLVLTHVQELVEQNEEDLRKLAPELDVGVYCSALGRRDEASLVTIASVQSIYRRLDAWADVGLVIIDEAHRITPVGGKMYRAVMDYFTKKGVPLVGLTATPFRMGTGYLHQGEHKLFDEISFEVPYERLVEEGYLCGFATQGSGEAYDTAKLHVRMGEFVQSELDELVDYPKTKRIVEQFLKRSEGRKHKMIFAINLRHCAIIKEILQEEGVDSVIISGDMDKTERRNNIAMFKMGLVDILINCNVLTTGFNFKALDCIGIFRPLASIVLYIQICGRGTRTIAGKQDCLLLDYGGNISRFGHFARPEIRERRKSGATKNCTACGEMNSIMARYCTACNAKFDEMFKDCPKCDEEVDRSAQTCPKCGYGWPVNENKLDEDGATILPNQTVWIQVTDWSFRVHEKAGSPYKSFVARYKTPNAGTIEEYVFPEHPSTKAKFATWWRRHTNAQASVPETAGKAFAFRQHLRRPKRLKVIRSGKFYVFLDRSFIDEQKIPIKAAISNHGGSESALLGAD